jgi:toxin ParE1/3/4
MAYKVEIDRRVHLEIEQTIGYLVERNFPAAKKLFEIIQKTYLALSKNPYYQVRYKQIRCIPIKGFPFMFHFSINEKTNVVQIHAFIHTAKNPKKNWLK